MFPLCLHWILCLLHETDILSLGHGSPSGQSEHQYSTFVWLQPFPTDLTTHVPPVIGRDYSDDLNFQFLDLHSFSWIYPC